MSNAERYDKICVDYVARTVNNYNQEAVEKFLKNVEKLDKILELGSGSGNNLMYMFGQGRYIQGSDNVLGFYEWISSRFTCPFSFIDFSDVDFVNSYVHDYEIVHLFCHLALDHLSYDEIQKFFQKVKFSGVFYFSVYQGRGTIINEEKIEINLYSHRQIMRLLQDRFEVVEFWQGDDPLKSERQVLNYIVKIK